MTALEWGKSPEEYFFWSKNARILAIASLRVRAALTEVLAEAAREKVDREARLRRG